MHVSASHETFISKCGCWEVQGGCSGTMCLFGHTSLKAAQFTKALCQRFDYTLLQHSTVLCQWCSPHPASFLSSTPAGLGTAARFRDKNRSWHISDHHYMGGLIFCHLTRRCSTGLWDFLVRKMQSVFRGRLRAIKSAESPPPPSKDKLSHFSLFRAACSQLSLPPQAGSQSLSFAHCCLEGW